MLSSNQPLRADSPYILSERERKNDMPSIAGYVQKAEEQGKSFSRIVLESQAQELEMPVEQLEKKMRKHFQVMWESAREGENAEMRSASGLTGGAAAKVMERAQRGESLCGAAFGKAVARALAVSECNACMGRIVAAPTAGSCGILPAALITVMEEKNLPEEAAVAALFTAAGVGMVIAANATVSGAQGGCQAEVGSASAMAAAAVVEMAGGTPKMCADACAIALKNVLGLVCDPVAGLVEVPCVKRNAMGVVNALAAAEMALAGVSSVIPADEVIVAMKRVGNTMPASLRETAEGGLADTPTGRIIAEKIFGKV